MKLWAAVTVLLYLLVLFALSAPVLLLCYGHWWGPEGGGVTLGEAIKLYADPAYWIWLAVLGLCQVLMLFAPVRTEKRLPPKRPLLVPILTTGFLLANLVLCAIVCVLCLCFADGGVMIFAIIGEFVADDAGRIWGLLFGPAGVVTSPGIQFAFGVITATSVFWLLWGLTFYWSARSADPQSLIKRSTRWIFRGSIAELLVAVPSHLVVRHRHDCCAPIATFWGITTGLSLMLLAFGPGVYFLFVERANRLRPKTQEAGADKTA
jgi:hypothetical protein